MARLGLVELLFGLIPLLVIGWVLSLANRAVRALESIAESLRQKPPQASGAGDLGRLDIWSS